jgi:predicted short-subunit dehydrogenase-like oxidoreductase (DUF2520 family)
VQFIGSGKPCAGVDELPSSDCYLFATSDDALGEVAARFAKRAKFQGRPTAFHCSGALTSTILLPLKERGFQIASVHPVKSFASPTRAVATFVGTPCAAEGDAEAVRLLATQFDTIGGRLFPIAPEGKLLYHTSFSFACAYIVTLIDTATQLCENAGLSKANALEILHSLVRDTVENVFTIGAERSLTGPIARGDAALVRTQLNELRRSAPAFENVYRELGEMTVTLARSAHTAAPESLMLLEQLFADED